MLCWRLILAAASFVSLFGAGANCQVRPSGDPTAKVRKNWDLGPRPAEAVEARDGFIDDPAILGYLQQLDVKLATAAGVLPMQVRLTRSTGQYARPRPPRALYVSAGLLDRLEDEAELAGLLAHELAHLANGQKGGCVMATLVAPALPEETRERERQATTAAVSYLKTAGYDPAGVLGLLSKVAYEHPAWAKAIASDDLLDIRVRLEGETTPATAYRVDSSDFWQVHRSLAALLGKVTGTVALSSQPLLTPSR